MSVEASRRLWNDGADGIEHDEHSKSRDHYVAWQQARVRQIIEESGVPKGDDDILFSQITERLGLPDLVAFDDAKPVLDELRARGLALAICSNWDWDLLEAIDNAGPDRHRRRRRLLGVGRRPQAASADLRRHPRAARHRCRRRALRRRHLDVRRRGPAAGGDAARLHPAPPLRRRLHRARGRAPTTTASSARRTSTCCWSSSRARSCDVDAPRA